MIWSSEEQDCNRLHSIGRTHAQALAEIGCKCCLRRDFFFPPRLHALSWLSVGLVTLEGLQGGTNPPKQKKMHVKIQGRDETAVFRLMGFSKALKQHLTPKFTQGKPLRSSALNMP